jgi:D-alanine-D-alanine ligase
MNIQVNENWWKDLFDEIYLLTDARSVCDPELTRQEVDFLEDTLPSDKNIALLDLCGGQGRHSLELARRGFRNLTVLDFSKYLIDVGRKRAEQEDLNVKFVFNDARKTGLPPGSFNYIIIMASSFGYFPNEVENQRILNETYRLLASGGVLLMDLPNKEYVLDNFKPSSSHQVNADLTASRERKLGKDIIYSKETVISKSKGLIRERTYFTRLYSPEKIEKLLKKAGFTSVLVQKNFMNRSTGEDYGCMTNRMVVLTKKG